MLKHGNSLQKSLLPCRHVPLLVQLRLFARDLVNLDGDALDLASLLEVLREPRPDHTTAGDDNCNAISMNSMITQ